MEQQIIVIFNKPIDLPDDQMQKIKTYGITFERSEKTTFDRIERYIKRYIFVIAELFKEGWEHIDVWTYKKNDKELYVDGLSWEKYVQKVEKANRKFAIFEEGLFDLKMEKSDFFDDLLFTNKEKWKQFKKMKQILWH